MFNEWGIRIFNALRMSRPSGYGVMKKTNHIDDWTLVFKSPQMLCAFGFGSGLSKIVPGTVGTLAAIPFYFLMLELGWIGYALVVLFSAVIGVYFCSYASKALNVHDHSGIVWDEFVGFWITMFMVPPTWSWIAIGFVLFRFFDMVKPWPISVVDRKVHGGFGIMFDDILAGVAALICMQGLLWYFT